jgi:hypothetical protein
MVLLLDFPFIVPLLINFGFVELLISITQQLPSIIPLLVMVVVPAGKVLLSASTAGQV